jgi:N6-L-threonylcarbamoyladenine synthase
MRKKNLSFSFSGLKTAVLYDLVNRNAYDLKNKHFLASDNLTLKQQVASSLLVCIKDIFIDRLTLALEEYPQTRAITFVGGVACNAYLREKLMQHAQRNKLELYVPSPKYCTDNAGMIAFVASKKAEHGMFDNMTLDIF